MYLTIGNHSTSDSADLGDLEYLFDLNLTCGNLFLNLIKHTLHSCLDIVHSVVDDGVGVDFHTLLLCKFLSCYGRTHLEAYYHTVLGSRGEGNVVLGYLTYALEDNVDLYFLC